MQSSFVLANSRILLLTRSRTSKILLMYPNAFLTAVERVFEHGKRDARSETKAVAVPRSRWPSIHGGQCFKIVSAC